MLGHRRNATVEACAAGEAVPVEAVVVQLESLLAPYLACASVNATAVALSGCGAQTAVKTVLSGAPCSAACTAYMTGGLPPEPRAVSALACARCAPLRPLRGTSPHAACPSPTAAWCAGVGRDCFLELVVGIVKSVAPDASPESYQPQLGTTWDQCVAGSSRRLLAADEGTAAMLAAVLRAAHLPAAPLHV